MSEWNLEAHEAWTDDIRDTSNMHFPNSCYRPAMKGGEHIQEPFVDWGVLKQQAWVFSSMPYGEQALDFICPWWWNATACECDCGNCHELFMQCPIGFTLYRSISLLCGIQRDPGTRVHELVRKRWGCGLLTMARLRIGFIDIVHSGWPYFGVLSRVSEQLRMDGYDEQGAIAIPRLAQVLGAAGRETSAPTMCGLMGWNEDFRYKDYVEAALNSGEVAPLDESIRAMRDDVCPLQRAVARAATADWLLRPGRDMGGKFNRYGWLTEDGLLQVEDLFIGVENDIHAWAGVHGDACKAARPYFFELLVASWPVWRTLHRAGVKLLGALSFQCKDGGLPRGAAAAVPVPDDQVPADRVQKICPACECPAQGEWAAEARYVSEYAERLSQALFLRASCRLDRGPVARRAARLAADPFRSWFQRWSAFTARLGPEVPQRLGTPAPPRDHGAELHRREAFATVLFARGSALEPVLLHTEAIRTLAFSIRKHCVHPRPFLVITDGPLPDIAGAALEADGISVVEVSPDKWSFPTAGTAFGVDSDTDVALTKWWLERGIAPTAVKLSIWNMTEYDRLVFLDADTLVLQPVDELFQVNAFASGLNPYSTHTTAGMVDGVVQYNRQPAINTGVMVVRPDAAIAALMAQQMAEGIHDGSPVVEHLGQSDQPWLDAFWLHHSRRLGVARFAGPPPGRPGGRGQRFLGCDKQFGMMWGQPPRSRGRVACDPARPPGRRERARPSRPLVRPREIRQSYSHCVLPLEYDFFVDFKAVRMSVWFEGTERRGKRTDEQPKRVASLANISDAAWAAEQYVNHYWALGEGGIKILHWPGEMRKPWHRWHRAVRSKFDDAWWIAHDAMCKQSTAPCHIECSA